MGTMVTYTVEFQFEVYDEKVDANTAIALTQPICESAVRAAYPEVVIPEGISFVEKFCTGVKVEIPKSPF